MKIAQINQISFTQNVVIPFQPSCMPSLAKPGCLPHQQSKITRGSRAQASSNHVQVTESLTLLRFPDSADQDSVRNIVDQVWSLQYMVAGPISGAAGSFAPLDAAPPSAGPAFTHAVLFRYGQQRLMESFISNERTQSMLTSIKGDTAEEVATLCFNTAVPNELEAIFRRGDEWDVGQELVMALALRPGSSAADAAEFLDLTQQLATSSAFGAVQAASGACLAADSPLQPRPDFVLMARFQSREQLEGFVRCPPIEAVLVGDERSPLKALWAGALEVAPAEQSNSSPQGRGGLGLP